MIEIKTSSDVKCIYLNLIQDGSLTFPGVYIAKIKNNVGNETDYYLLFKNLKYEKDQFAFLDLSVFYDSLKMRERSIERLMLKVSNDLKGSSKVNFYFFKSLEEFCVWYAEEKMALK